jgi:hypothetical protein
LGGAPVVRRESPRTEKKRGRGIRAWLAWFFTPLHNALKTGPKHWHHVRESGEKN